MSDLVIKKGSTVLADGTLHTGAIVLTAANGQERQIALSDPILAAVVSFIDHETQQGAFSFVLNRQHSTEALALDHFFRHPQTVLGVADFVVEFTDDSSVLHRWTAADCAWRAAALPELPGGIATRVQYTVDVTSWAYENSEGGALPSIPVQVGADRQTDSISGAGTNTIALSSTVRELFLKLTVSAGTGSYVYNVVLPETGREEGNFASVRVTMPASTNPTVRIYTGSTSGTLLATVPTDSADAFKFTYEFIFNGTNWELWDASQSQP